MTPLERLRTLWNEELAKPNPEINAEIDNLINCTVVSIRYALLTQLLGKATDAGRDALSIQRGYAATAAAAGRWDARSFCQDNIVPWVTESDQVLGTSSDPYVSNPLRRPRLDAGYEPRRNRHLWDGLVEVLRTVQEQDDATYTETRLRQCLASLVQQYNALAVQFDVPQRISLDDTLEMIVTYLDEPSGGERPQIVVAGLMRTIGEMFGIFDQVVRQAINEADAAGERPGDVICFDGEELVLSVEVKDRTVTLQDADAAIGKARRSGVTEVLFASASSAEADPKVTERIQREFGLGINIYQLGIETMLRVLLSIVGESGRTRFLTLVGEELNDRVTQPMHKLAWQNLLRTL